MIYFPEDSLEEIRKGSPIEKERKLREFKSLKDRLASLKRSGEKTQEGFEQYITTLFDNEQCKYKTGIKDIISLCNNNLHDCKFRSRDNFNFHGKLKFECLREKTLKLKSLL